MNFIFRFIKRWMKFDASPPLAFDNSGESPPHLFLLNTDEFVPVYLDTGIGSGSYSSPASVSCTLLLDASDGPGFTLSGADTETIYNCYGVTVSSGKFAWGKWRGPYLYLIAADC
jgi:hypothetical protein